MTQSGAQWNASGAAAAGWSSDKIVTARGTAVSCHASVGAVLQRAGVLRGGSLLAGAWLCLVASACGGEARFNVAYAPGMPRSGAKISVFAVKRDGILSRRGWDALSEVLSAPYGARQCEVGYSDALFEAKPVLAEAIEGYVRTNGVTDGLFTQLEPAAQGDMILLVTSSGRVKASTSDPVPADASGGRRGGRGMGGGGGLGRRQQLPAESHSASDFDGLTLSALFYSVSDHRLGGSIELRYSGHSAEEALAEFRDRLERELPAAHCAGWDWSAAIAPEQIRKLAQE